MPAKVERYIYGSDIDGNRGVPRTDIEFTSDFSNADADYRIDGSYYSKDEAVDAFIPKLNLESDSKDLKVFDSPVALDDNKKPLEQPKKTVSLWNHDDEHYFLGKDKEGKISLMFYEDDDFKNADEVDESEFHLSSDGDLVHDDDIIDYLHDVLDAENVEDIDLEQEARDAYDDDAYDRWRDSQED